MACPLPQREELQLEERDQPQTVRVRIPAKALALNSSDKRRCMRVWWGRVRPVLAEQCLGIEFPVALASTVSGPAARGRAARGLAAEVVATR